MKGCLLPHLVFVRSDHIPTKGSETASKTNAIAKAAAANVASSPKAWL